MELILLVLILSVVFVLVLLWAKTDARTTRTSESASCRPA